MYTFILDFQGGTYVGQADGTLETALENWLSDLEFGDLSGHDLGILRNSLLEDRPTPLDGLKNVWCSTGSIEDDLAIVHMIETTNSANVPGTV
jgi:hypothetical protein